LTVALLMSILALSIAGLRVSFDHDPVCLRLLIFPVLFLNGYSLPLSTISFETSLKPLSE
jgi:hypothetical protein